jgi:hypothetical protein
LCVNVDIISIKFEGYVWGRGREVDEHQIEKEGA